MGAHGSAQPWLWASTVIVAHLFAAIWLLRALSFMAPGAWPAAKQRIRRLCGQCATHELPVDDAAKADAPARQLAVSIHSQDADLVPRAAGGHNQTHLSAQHSSILLPPMSSQQEHSAHDDNSGMDSASDGGSINDQEIDGVVLTLAPACATKKHNTAVPLPPTLQLEWCALGCSYRTPTGHKTVLEDVWGSAQAGQLQVSITFGCRPYCDDLQAQATRAPPMPSLASPLHCPMQALLGPSGAGKSTLLDLLAGRKATGRLAGRVLLNGAPLGPSNCRKLAAYVPQVKSKG
jgi:hypothetical protein